MSGARRVPWSAAICVVAAILGPGVRREAVAAIRLTSTSAVSSRRGPPLAFEENRGQTDARFGFIARTRGMTALLAPAEATFAFDADGEGADVVTLRFAGASDAAEIVGLGPLGHRSTSFIGSDPSKWTVGARNFARAAVRDLQPGIDLVWRGDEERRLEYDLVVAPGADVSGLAFVVEGARDVGVAADGSLVATTERGELRQSRPVAFQDVDGVRRPVEAAFALDGGSVRFEIGAHDPRRTLVIDPAITWSTFLGGGGNDGSRAIAVDSSGAVYVLTTSNSINFPLQSAFQGSLAGAYDYCVTKLNPAGTALVYSTYLGGTGGEGGSGYGSIAVDGSGAAYVCGVTDSIDFPTQGAFQGSSGGLNDSFVAKLSASGSTLVYSSYLGGTGGEYGSEITIDSTGAAYVTGTTSSTDFPTQSPLQSSMSGAYQDAFVAKVNPSGSALVFSTYLGGGGVNPAGVSVVSFGQGIAVDSTGAVYVAGSTGSPMFPLQSPIQSTYGGQASDAFLVKLTASGSSLVYSTYLGGSLTDGAWALAVDSTGAAFVGGFTQSSNFPATASSYQPTGGGATVGANTDAFVAKVNAAGSSVVWSTFLGGSGADVVYGIGLDSQGAVSVCGMTTSQNFPTISPTQANHGGANQDGFVARLNSTGTQLVFSTYVGGGGNEWATNLAVDATGAAYVSGYTSASNFPVVGGYQTTFGGTQDGWVVKYGLAPGGGGGPPPVPPKPPIDLVAAYEAGKGITLAWTDSSIDEDGFVVERMPMGYSFATIGTTPGNTASYTDEQLYPNTTYTYRVRAFSYLNGQSPWSNEAAVTTPDTVPVPVPPSAPTDVSAIAADDGSIGVSWTDNSVDEVLFGVDRTEGGAAPRTAASVRTDVTGISDYDVHPGWPYAYRVRALSLQGPSPWSNSVTAIVPDTVLLSFASGSMSDSGKRGRDKFAATVTFALDPSAYSQVFDPVGLGLELRLGPSNASSSVSIAPDDAGWKLKTKKDRHGGPPALVSATWKSPKGASLKAVVVVDFAKRTIGVKASAFDFAGTASSNARLLVAAGADGGGTTSAWTESKPGVFKFVSK